MGIQTKTTNKMKNLSTNHTSCRICGSEELIPYLDLGMMPLANNLEATEEAAVNKQRFPLQVMLCKQCGLSQLSVVIDPEELFNYYTYRSGINNGYIRHCQKMAREFKRKFKLNHKTFHIDIAGNDGTLLAEFRKILGHRVLNIDPAANLTKVAEDNYIPSLTRFWGLQVTYEIGERADLLTATNVFAHLDDIAEFLLAAKGMLKKDSVLVIENPYLMDFIDNMEFDTVYFEHVSYWSVLPMLALCKRFHMKLIAAEKQEIHGGSMRYIITREESKYHISPDVERLRREELERGFNKPDVYIDWARKVTEHISDFRQNLINLKLDNNTIIAFAASAKGNTLLNCAGVNSDLIDCIIDETPEKIGRFYPGNGIPIVEFENIERISPDYILILSWNFREEIIKKIRKSGYTGKFIVPIPRWEVI